MFTLSNAFRCIVGKISKGRAYRLADFNMRPNKSLLNLAPTLCILKRQQYVIMRTFISISVVSSLFFIQQIIVFLIVFTQSFKVLLRDSIFVMKDKSVVIPPIHTPFIVQMVTNLLNLAKTFCGLVNRQKPMSFFCLLLETDYCVVFIDECVN